MKLAIIGSRSLTITNLEDNLLEAAGMLEKLPDVK